MVDSTREHAVVLGAGMAGLLAARVLAPHYGRVTVLDRDDEPEGPGVRRGVPQGRHAHALLTQGQTVLEQLFPTLTEELSEHGAPVGDVGRHARMLIGGRRLQRCSADLTFLSCSRPLLEHRVRARVRNLGNVRISPGSDVAGLRCASDGRTIIGVRVVPRSKGAAEVLDAELVVDATGRSSRASVWLEALHLETPSIEEVRVDVGYATRRYHLPADALGGDLACVHGPAPGQIRGGVLARLESDMWMLTLFGMLGDHPPLDEQAFDAFARSLLHSDIADAITTGPPADDPVGFRFRSNLRRRFERRVRPPDGLLVIGDALASLNPIYGQGISVAALQAATLADLLTDGREQQADLAVPALARVVDVPWELATGADLATPGVQGRTPLKLRTAGRWVPRVQAAAARDPLVAAQLLRVMHLVDRPETLMGPRTAVRVLKARSAAGNSATG